MKKLKFIVVAYGARNHYRGLLSDRLLRLTNINLTSILEKVKGKIGVASGQWIVVRLGKNGRQGVRAWDLPGTGVRGVRRRGCVSRAGKRIIPAMGRTQAETTLTCPQAVVELVARFAEHREAYQRQTYNETQVRREFIDPFFKVLGWDIDNEQGAAEAYKDVIHEDAIKVGGASKAPDYCFRIGGTRKFFVEAKKPAVGVDSNSMSTPTLIMLDVATSGGCFVSVRG